MRLLITTAIIALSAGVASAQSLGSSDSSISVQGGTLANQPVAFGNTGRISNNGFGTASLASSIGVAQYGASGYAFFNPSATPTVASSGSGASVDSTFTRQVETSGASIGQGTLVSAGTTSSTFSGDVDAASDGAIRTIAPTVGGPAGSNTLTNSEASTTATAGLGGSGTTSSGIQLTGTNNGFVGTASNEVAGTQRALALGSNNTLGATGSAQAINPFLQADVAAGTLGDLADARASTNGGNAGLVFVFDDSNGVIGAGGAIPNAGVGAPTISGVNLTIPNLGGGTIVAESTTNGSSSGFFGASGNTLFGQIVQ